MNFDEAMQKAVLGFKVANASKVVTGMDVNADPPELGVAVGGLWEPYEPSDEDMDSEWRLV